MVSLAVGLMVLLAVQVGLQPILAKEFVSAAVFPTAAVLASEVYPRPCPSCPRRSGR